MNAMPKPEARRPTPVDPDAFRPDPHAGYAAVRPLAAVITFGAGMPMVTRYADVAGLMTDQRTRQMETEVLTMRGIASGPLFDFYANSMLQSNRPHHAKRRGPVGRTFAHKLIQDWRPYIRRLAHEMIDDVVAEGAMDVVEAISTPLPMRLMCAILGADAEDAPEISAKTLLASRGLGAFRDAELPAIEAASADLIAMAERLLAERRRAPSDDFLSAYIARVDEAGALSELETLIQIVNLMIAGGDTTRVGIAAMVSLLLEHEDAWRAVVADPSLAPGAALEALRFEPPIGSIGRVALEPMFIDDIRIEAGAALGLSIVSAQRDPAVYRAPDRFDVRRDDHPRFSLSFGFGAHRCLGEALARAEMEEVLLALAERLPDLELDGPPATVKGHSGIRGISETRVRWRTPR